MIRKLLATLAMTSCLASVAHAADVLDTAAATGQARTLVEAAQATGISNELRTKGPFTVFVPTDEAWAQLPAPVVDQLLADQRLLTEVLKHHIVPGNVRESELGAKVLQTARGDRLAMDRTTGQLGTPGARIVRANVEADNGTVYLIDKVLLPGQGGR